ncbi:alpha/beta hydrolase [Furfurilactobacillus milii]|uniref:Alpha/beta hydrolase n=1 Tax=Furfurilactobacillus milii TaxID=2888272 RepID=A0ABT6DDL5_9LACO|nr:alpha/beta hydrolase [Furfurilactobacillus milii]QLE66753.1 cell surface hydrolase [Furfurilactobacillus rossiae]MCF6160638.1 alpha/beta hydrolase [Furfurilactobacillus milii]MCF6162870.1 alpha/beta hydrolase [Furfurilactobacillus milii]MDF9913451.1 alpha/beta hydrolase [Furfurilactobacillus milii]QLE69183.1 cell surface hydrolase [Furfurilactobacillus rossiae]
MTNKIKRWLFVGGLFVFVIVVTCFTIPWVKSSVTKPRAIRQSQMSPVIFIPGSSAGQNRFDDLFKTINSGQGVAKNVQGGQKSTPVQHSIVKITVKENDTLQVTGQVRAGDNTPFFVVAFENNHDGYTNIKKQARWFNIAFNYLAKKYNFNNFSGFGHSNGGLIYTLFLENYFNQSKFKMHELMMLGSPFNLEEKDQSKRVAMLDDMVDNRNKLPSSLNVYLVAGTENYTNDGIVPVDSVYAGKYVYQDQVAHFTELTVTDSDAEHSDLPQNKQIVSLMSQNLLQFQERQPRMNNGTTNQKSKNNYNNPDNNQSSSSQSSSGSSKKK